VDEAKLIAPETLLRPTLRRMSRAEQLGYWSNQTVRRRAMQAKARVRELRARAAGHRFKCAALSGESNYNIAINADLSVSCNCDDTSGEGRLGSMRDQSFEAVFRGAKAHALRRALAEGTIPLTRCIQCPELQEVPADVAARAVEDYRLPTQGVMLENNAACNLSCVACYRAMRPLERLKMRIEEVRRVGTELAELGIQRVSFFTLGEPFMSRNILDEMRTLREVHPTLKIFTSTNGVLVDDETKRLAALEMDTVFFSVDGSDQRSLERYQIGSDFEKAYRNLCDLVELRDRLGSATVIRWKYVVFNWNDRRAQVERAVRLAREAKVDVLEFWFTLNPFYGVSHRFFHAAHFTSLAPMSPGRRRLIALTERGREALTNTEAPQSSEGAAAPQAASPSQSPRSA
jgi:uncharacterized Fe-S cluster-containing radical SAM superfamily protein